MYLFVHVSSTTFSVFFLRIVALLICIIYCMNRTTGVNHIDLFITMCMLY